MKRRSQIGFYGKLPSFGDFVGWQTSEPVWRRFSEYFDDGLSYFRKRCDEFDEIFPRLPQATILLYPRDKSMALMVLVDPSRDRVGRHYPFMAFTSIVKKHWSRLLLPEIYRGFECNTWEALKDCASIDNVSEVRRELMHRMITPSHSCPSDAEERFRRWAGDTQAGSWLSQLSCAGETSVAQGSDARDVQASIREAGRCAAGSAPATWPLSGDRRQFGMEITVWQIMLMKLQQSEDPPSALMWFSDGDSGGRLRMFQEIPQSSSLFDFWRTSLNLQASEGEIAEPGTPNEVSAPKDDLVGQLLKADERSLAEVLQL